MHLEKRHENRANSGSRGDLMRILYFRPDTADCTADPHYVNYDDLNRMLEDVLTVLESDLVKSITRVLVYGEDGTLYKSDLYSVFSGSWGDDPPVRKLAEGEYAKMHKVEGLYFAEDAEDDVRLPVGLTGYRHLMNLIPTKLPWERIESISIGVIWAFANDHSCSDYITIDPMGMSIDYSNQDWWTDLPGYRQHCADLGGLIGADIEPSDE